MGGSVAEPAQKLIAQGHRGAKETRLDTLALTGEIPVAQRRHDAERRERAGPHVIESRPDVNRDAVPFAGREHRSARHGLHDHVVPGFAAEGTMLPKRHMFEEHDARVHCANVFVRQAVAGEVGWLHRDHDDIGPPCQAFDDGPRLGSCHIEAYRSLAAVDERVALGFAGQDRLHRVTDPVAGRRFDFHDVSAHISQEQARKRHSQRLCELHYADTGKRAGKLAHSGAVYAVPALTPQPPPDSCLAGEEEPIGTPSVRHIGLVLRGPPLASRPSGAPLASRPSVLSQNTPCPLCLRGELRSVPAL
jgi:hypothetical protein